MSAIQAAGGIGLHVNADKTESTCLNQKEDMSTLNGVSLKLVKKFTNLWSSFSSTENLLKCFCSVVTMFLFNVCFIYVIAGGVRVKYSFYLFFFQYPSTSCMFSRKSNRCMCVHYNLSLSLSLSLYIYVTIPPPPPHTFIILLTIHFLAGRWSTSGPEGGNAHFLPLQEYDRGGRRK